MSALALEACMHRAQELDRTGTAIDYEVAAIDREGLGKSLVFLEPYAPDLEFLETFIDEGDVDMIRILRILRKNGYDGVLIPDHTPQMDCAAPWHAGMAHALGYLRAALKSLT